MEANYKRTVAGSVGAGMAAVFNASGRQYYILEHKTESLYHHAGESQKIIVDQVELGRDSSCQVRFDESFETVSRRHAAIVKEGENWKLVPLSQTNSTIVNGQVITSEKILNSGDEIRLSSRGPLMGFIVPQGKQSLVSSIGMTERLNLFRQQALRPYKRAMWIMALILVLAVGGLVAWNLYSQQQFTQELEAKQELIDQVQQDLSASDELINALNDELVNTQAESAAERMRIQQKLNAAQAEREALLESAAALRDELQNAADVAAQAGQNVEAAQSKIEGLEQQLKEEEARKEEEAKAAEEAKKSSLNSLINRNTKEKPTLSTEQKPKLKKF
ncbi:MAG: FHA domain-containing protein [Bacteroidales bacterium]|nr:FHA domain-containing protein [Bacteroidales bacterium]MBQ6687815.1 FHA domain-containing protein [Bacteroidales bacterium]